MSLAQAARAVETFVSKNSPTILSTVATAGVVGTAYLTGKATVTATRRVDMMEDHAVLETVSNRDKVEACWKLYIPAATVGVATVATIVASNRISNRRTAAITAAYALSERAYANYKEKVQVELGKKAHKTVVDSLAKDRVEEHETEAEFVPQTSGESYVIESFTGRIFRSSMEDIRKAQNDLNDKLIKHDQAYLSDFYAMLGVEDTSHSYLFGWTSDKLLELDITSAINKQGIPCLVFDYNYVGTLR